LQQYFLAVNPMKVTLRQTFSFSKAVEELKIRGNWDFRCTIAQIALPARTHLEQWQEKQKPAKGILAYQTELELHKKNCTEGEGDKAKINVALFMPLFHKAQETHKKAIEAAEKLQDDANKSLDEMIEIDCYPISNELVKLADEEEKFDGALLAKLLPFMEK
jgi:hypothetical protein